MDLFFNPMMMKLYLFLSLLGAVTLMNAQNPTYPPVNDLGKDSSLVKFVNLLKVASANKDIKFLAAQLDKEVMSSFDGENTVNAFYENWQVTDDSTVFWSLLSRTLDIGGAYVNDPEDETGRYQVVFPYIYTYPLSLDDDPYALGVIMGKNVNLRERPDTKAAVKTQLSYDLISFLYEEEESTAGKNADGSAEWYLVETYNQKFKGWVNWKFVYSMSGPRLFLFKNSAGKWKISSFVSGD